MSEINDFIASMGMTNVEKSKPIEKQIEEKNKKIEVIYEDGKPSESISENKKNKMQRYVVGKEIILVCSKCNKEIGLCRSSTLETDFEIAYCPDCNREIKFENVIRDTNNTLWQKPIQLELKKQFENLLKDYCNNRIIEKRRG